MIAHESSSPVAVVTGGSAGLGRVIACALMDAGYRVVIIARNADRVAETARQLGQRFPRGQLWGIQAELESHTDVARAFDEIRQKFGRVDVLVNNVGMSDRGTLANLDADRLMRIISANLVPTLRCSQAALAMLAESRGVVVNIGSLAGKVGARYLGGYPAAKHALSGLTQQMRLEWKEHGVHVALVNPGPIRREDAGARYESAVAGDRALPDQASSPGGGTRVRGIEAERVAASVLRVIRRRRPDIMLPAYLRPLVAIGNLWPPLGDWLLLKFTSARRATGGH